jgi:hypothetical protein
LHCGIGNANTLLMGNGRQAGLEAGERIKDNLGWVTDRDL